MGGERPVYPIIKFRKWCNTVQTEKLPKIVVVEDNPEMLAALVSTLKSEKLRVRGFPSAEELIEALDWLDDIDCLIVDHKLPGMSGEDLLRHLQVRQLGSPVIMLTGNGEIPAAVRAIKLGAVDYIVKPVDADTLIVTVRSALEMSYRRTDPTVSPPSRDVLSGLTERQREILALVGKGLTSKEIAIRLNLSHRTVETHRAAMMKQLAAKSAADLIRFGIENANALNQHLSVPRPSSSRG
jgi:FixJ family two-component response regulator